MIGARLWPLLLALAACASAPEPARELFAELAEDPATFTTAGQPARWTRLPDGALEVRPGAGNLVSADEFGDQTITLEFWCPAMDPSLGIDRGNSGVYVQGRYEVQILDSYEMPLALNSCGAIYQISAPRVNASLPPERWQSLRIEFTAARPDALDASGEPATLPRISVWQNGIQIQDKVELPHVTPGGLGTNMPARGPLMLQDHGQLVRFRKLVVTPHDEHELRIGFSFGAGMLVD